MSRVTLLIPLVFLSGCQDTNHPRPADSSIRPGAVTVSPRQIDFGNVNDGKVRKAEVTVTNGTPETISWTRLETSCDCLSCDIASSQLLSGQQARIGVAFDPLKEGDFRGGLLMTVTAFDRTNAAVFTFEVAALVKVNP